MQPLVAGVFICIRACNTGFDCTERQTLAVCACDEYINVAASDGLLTA